MLDVTVIGKTIIEFKNQFPGEYGFINVPKKMGPYPARIYIFQSIAKKVGFYSGKVDGVMGPLTQASLDLALIWLEGKNFSRVEDDVKEVVSKTAWPDSIPQSNLTDFYGRPGSNLTTVELPYPHKLSWDKPTTITTVRCHSKVAEAYQNVLIDVLENYGYSEISKLGLDIFGGCFNIRKMRGGELLSTHSWGIAFDYDPENNRLHWNCKKANFAKPEYKVWLNCWKRYGFTSLGLEKDFDWMHFQAADI